MGPKNLDLVLLSWSVGNPVILDGWAFVVCIRYGGGV